MIPLHSTPQVIARFSSVSSAAAALDHSGESGGDGILSAGAAIGAFGGAHARTLVLRLDTHVVVTNRTGYSLNLIQPEARRMRPQQWGAADRAGVLAAAGASARSAASGQGLHSELFAPVSSRAQAAAAVAETLQLAPGAVGVPLHWGREVAKRLLSLALPEQQQQQQQQGGGGWLLWSEPFRAECPAGAVEMEVVVPVFCLGEAGQYDDKPYIWYPHQSSSVNRYEPRQSSQVTQVYINFKDPFNLQQRTITYLMFPCPLPRSR